MISSEPIGLVPYNWPLTFSQMERFILHYSPPVNSDATSLLIARETILWTFVLDYSAGWVCGVHRAVLRGGCFEEGLPEEEMMYFHLQGESYLTNEIHASQPFRRNELLMAMHQSAAVQELQHLEDIQEKLRVSEEFAENLGLHNRKRIREGERPVGVYRPPLLQFDPIYRLVRTGTKRGEGFSEDNLHPDHARLFKAIREQLEQGAEVQKVDSRNNWEFDTIEVRIHFSNGKILEGELHPHGSSADQAFCREFQARFEKEVEKEALKRKYESFDQELDSLQKEVEQKKNGKEFLPPPKESIQEFWKAYNEEGAKSRGSGKGKYQSGDQPWKRKS